METLIARVISYILHPLLIPTYSLLILFQIKTYVSHSIPYKAKLTIISIVFLNTFVLPVIMFYFMKLRGLLSSFTMENRKERILPYIVTAIFYYATFYLLKKFQLPSIIYYIVFGSTSLIVIALIINFWWKISAHMLAMGGMAGAFSGISFYLSINMGALIALIILFSGLVGFSRLKLHSHTQAQVYTGFVIGAGFMGALFYLLL